MRILSTSLREAMKKQNGHSFKASYTVEATLVFSICMMITASGILLGYHNYHAALKRADSRMAEIDAVDRFRKVQFGKEAFETIFDQDGTN